MAKKLLIIDTDCGIDDAQAVMMALAAPHIQVLGVTCVFGNAAVESVCQNVLRVLSVCEREGVRLLQQHEQAAFHFNDLTLYIYAEHAECFLTDPSVPRLSCSSGWIQ